MNTKSDGQTLVRMPFAVDPTPDEHAQQTFSHTQSTCDFSALMSFLFAAGLAVTIYFLHSMPGEMEMPGGWTMSMMWMRMPGETWLSSAAMFLVMWLSMMVAMMLPSALPMLLAFHRSLTEESAVRRTIAAMLVACGYFIVWVSIGVAVYIIGVLWALATMRSSALSNTVPTLTGVALV